MAEQQGRYLARMLNREESSKEKGDAIEEHPFVYRQLGMMASIGDRFIRLLSPHIVKMAQVACKHSIVLINACKNHMSLELKSHASVREGRNSDLSLGKLLNLIDMDKCIDGAYCAGCSVIGWWIDNRRSLTNTRTLSNLR